MERPSFICYWIGHTAKNGPYGFKSKHLSFFCGLCLYAGYWDIVSIFRKCHLGNFEQINFSRNWRNQVHSQVIIKQKFRLKALICFWVFLTIFFLTVYDMVSKFFNFSLTVMKLILATHQTPKSIAWQSKCGPKKFFWCNYNWFYFKKSFLVSNWAILQFT